MELHLAISVYFFLSLEVLDIHWLLLPKQLVGQKQRRIMEGNTYRAFHKLLIFFNLLTNNAK